MTSYFRDNQGKEWSVNLTLADCRRVKASIPIDVFNPAEYQMLISSLEIRLSYLWFLLQPQAAAADPPIGPADFEGRIYATPVEPRVAGAASDALLTELADFFLRLGQSGMSTMTEGHVRRMRTAREAQTPEFLERMNREIDRSINEVETEAEKLLGLDGSG